jgi:hypothetical protein
MFEVAKGSVPLIAFGNGMFNKDHVAIKGHRVGLTNTLWQTLKHRQRRGDLLLAYVDEYKTSKVRI